MGRDWNSPVLPRVLRMVLEKKTFWRPSEDRRERKVHTGLFQEDGFNSPHVEMGVVGWTEETRKRAFTWPSFL